MRFQTERDGQILEFIYSTCDGVVSRRHLWERFWPNSKTPRAMERRLAKLKHAEYIAWPTREQYRIHPIPEPIVWLDWRGILTLAGTRGVDVAAPTRPNETRLRKLANALRRQGMHWRRVPKWLSLSHDLAVVDIRLAIEGAVASLPEFSLEQWIGEYDFRSSPVDEVTYMLPHNKGPLTEEKRGVIPDGFFEVHQSVDGHDTKRGRFLLEFDNTTHAVVSKVVNEKFFPYAAYITSPAYKARTGVNLGIWLFVCSGGERMKNLLEACGRLDKTQSRYFLFATLDECLTSDNLFTEPIWWRPRRSEPWTLFPRE